MFGYISANQPELKVREFQVYRSYYCGLCHSIKKSYGQIPRLSLNHDLNFVALLLSSLDLQDAKTAKKRCLLHPLTKHLVSLDAYTDYAADMTILLTYYKCQDDWIDDHKKSAFLCQQYLKRSLRKVRRKYPQKCAAIEACLQEIALLEKKQSDEIDRLALLSGKMMAEIMTFQNERWHPILASLGISLGKFIYLMDAYEDLDRDLENHSFNVLISRKDDPEFETWIQEVLTLQMVKACEALQELPIVENEALLENILYSGVWTRYNALKQRKEAS